MASSGPSEDFSHFETIPDDLLYDMLLEFDIDTVISMCAVNKRYKGLCDAQFWRTKAVRDFPDVSPHRIRDLISSDDHKAARDSYLIINKVENGPPNSYSHNIPGIKFLINQANTKRRYKLMAYLLLNQLKNGTYIVKFRRDPWLMLGASSTGDVELITEAVTFLEDVYLPVDFKGGIELASKNGSFEAVKLILEMAKTRGVIIPKHEYISILSNMLSHINNPERYPRMYGPVDEVKEVYYYLLEVIGIDPSYLRPY